MSLSMVSVIAARDSMDASAGACVEVLPSPPALSSAAMPGEWAGADDSAEDVPVVALSVVAGLFRLVKTRISAMTTTAAMAAMIVGTTQAGRLRRWSGDCCGPCGCAGMVGVMGCVGCCVGAVCGCRRSKSLGSVM